MPDRPSFPIPNELEPDTYCLQIVMPNDPIWKAVIAGLLFQPAEWFNWQRDDNKSGKILAQYWRRIYNEIDWSDMSCCCPEPIPPQYRFEGTKLYRSTDGGITFNLAPEYDYRNYSTVWSKPSELGLESTKCQAADSVVVQFRDEINQQITEDMGAAAILGAIAAVILFFATAGTSSFISASVTGVVAAILGAGVTAWQAAFTTDVWDTFRCIVYCAMSDDESINQEGIDQIYAQIAEQLTGIVVPTLRGYVAAAGLVGIQNMLSSLSGDPDADCGDCAPCSDACAQQWADKLDSGYFYGHITEQTDEYVVVTCDVPNINGVYYSNIWTNSETLGCICGSELIEIISGSGVGHNWRDNPGGGGLTGGLFGLRCVNWIQSNSAAPFVVKYTFLPCDP